VATRCGYAPKLAVRQQLLESKERRTSVAISFEGGQSAISPALDRLTEPPNKGFERGLGIGCIHAGPRYGGKLLAMRFTATARISFCRSPSNINPSEGF
jgi:hypothetical protein